MDMSSLFELGPVRLLLYVFFSNITRKENKHHSVRYFNITNVLCSSSTQMKDIHMEISQVVAIQLYSVVSTREQFQTCRMHASVQLRQIGPEVSGVSICTIGLIFSCTSRADQVRSWLEPCSASDQVRNIFSVAPVNLARSLTLQARRSSSRRLEHWRTNPKSQNPCACIAYTRD
jgi:hypothetical protein